MLVKEIKENWKSYTFDKGKTHLLYDIDPKSGLRTPHKYLCNIEKVKRGWYKVINRGSLDIFWMRNNIDDLKEDVIRYVESLPYNCEFYNPTYRKGYFEELVVNDYLHNIGFESSGSFSNICSYVLVKNNIYGGKREPIHLTFKGLDCFDKISEDVDVSLSTGEYSWISVNCKRECSEIIQAIDNLLKPLLLTNSIDDFKTQEPLSVENFDLKLKALTASLDIGEVDYKEELISKLESTLAELKS